MTTIFDPIKLGDLELSNRIIMAPLTRCRADAGRVPNALMAEYYVQRASAGLILSEATSVTPLGVGYPDTPGIWSNDQVRGWANVTKAIHGAGGKIFLQLWHVGRISHESYLNGETPVAPSAIQPKGHVSLVRPLADYPTPRALETAEIADIVDAYRTGAENAKAAGFDGVEIHGANGYLIDQFLRTTSNHRTDAYGGTMDNRTRFAREVAAAVASEAGAERTGMRLAPFITQRNMNCPEIIPTMLHLAHQLDTLGLAYIHLAEADWDDAPSIPDDFRQALRNAFSGRVIVAGKYTPDRAQQILSSGMADLVAFGRPFIANPDLPARYAGGLPLATFDPATLFGGNEQGYSDYDPVNASAARPAFAAMA
jgi:N-ethylmaleimide reductase